MPQSLLDRVPDRIRNRLGAGSKICLLNGRDVLSGLSQEKLIVMGCNPRIKHVVPGIMQAAEELDAVIAFELTRSEGGVDGGYTGQTPETFFTTIVGYAESHHFSKPFFIHGDHVTVKDTENDEFTAAHELIDAELAAGYTSFAIDASFNALPDNIEITARLAGPVQAAGLGLEVEVGEVRPVGTDSNLTTVAEAEEFLAGLSARGINPQLLAMNNGSRHGNYLEGEPIAIDLERTREIYATAARFGLSGLVQHGITGTPLHLVGKLADYGIRKGNIGTLWQNVAHAGFPLDLMDAMRRWARESGRDIKYASGVFKADIDAISATHAEQIAELAYREAKEFLTAFRAVGSATLLTKNLAMGLCG